MSRGVAHGVFDIGVSEDLFLHFIKKKGIPTVHHKVAGECLPQLIPIVIAVMKIYAIHSVSAQFYERSVRQNHSQ